MIKALLIYDCLIMSHTGNVIIEILTDKGKLFMSGFQYIHECHFYLVYRLPCNWLRRLDIKLSIRYVQTFLRLGAQLRWFPISIS